MKTTNTVLVTLLSSLLSFGSIAQAANLCDNSQAQDQAKAKLAKVEAAAKKAGVATLISSSGVEECNPTTLIVASIPKGGMIPRIQLPETCGAIFTFKNEDDQRSFAQWIGKTRLNAKSQNVCVSINVGSPLPGVSGRNAITQE